VIYCVLRRTTNQSVISFISPCLYIQYHNSYSINMSSMKLKFILMVNKQGQTRLAQYYEPLTIQEKSALESEIIRKCLARTENQCSFLEHRNYKCVYRRYASLFFIVGSDGQAVCYIGVSFFFLFSVTSVCVCFGLFLCFEFCPVFHYSQCS
jgi:Clathrin adaptor complex small chain